MRTIGLEFDCHVNLTIDEIWPDGDAPDNPTVDDVIKVLKKCARNPIDLMRDWDLGQDVITTVRDNSINKTLYYKDW